ncbi:MAG: cytochrome c oxidase assembly protein [Rhodocyclaceae bacterium]|nr:cytochrome c oxidase assembly protein [Rhodocyclaceae bacterium]MBP7080316.1 cytochrome c oxidase assembly protein [Rhodocyclaceae bacterium]
MTALPANNYRLAGGLSLVVLASFVFAYLQPPLYRAFCEWTGIYDVQKADEFRASSVVGRPVTMEFDANTHGTGLRFTALQTSLATHTGELIQVNFRVENLTNHPVTGQAIPSYGPKHVGNFVKKLDCFCFRQQVFAPGEVRVLPVVFALDRTLPDDVGTVTLSYTFFEVPGGVGSTAPVVNGSATSGSGI